MIGKYVKLPEVRLTTSIQRKAYGTLQAARSAGLFDNLDRLAAPVKNLHPLSMERLGQGYGYTLYESILEREGDIERIRLYGANDRASFFMDEKPVLTLYDRELLSEYVFETPVKKGKKLSILMENMGRVNFSPVMEVQRKGIDRCVQINGHQHYNWDMYCLPMEDLSGLPFDAPAKEGQPGFYKFTFMTEEPGDTFLDFAGWGKGCAFVNGFNIGRFWELGPQRRLYIPAPLLKKGENTILIFETEGKAPGEIRLCDEPDLG